MEERHACFGSNELMDDVQSPGAMHRLRRLVNNPYFRNHRGKTARISLHDARGPVFRSRPPPRPKWIWRMAIRYWGEIISRAVGEVSQDRGGAGREDRSEGK
jgi:hypothetical protein